MNIKPLLYIMSHDHHTSDMGVQYKQKDEGKMEKGNKTGANPADAALDDEPIAMVDVEN